jgi:uncharacterized protein YxeA
MKKSVIQIVIVALLISVAPFMTTQASAATGNEIVNTATSLTGVRYQAGGTTPSGFDCSGYTSYVYKKHGITLSRASVSQYSAGKSVSKANLQAGDLVFFNNLGPGVTHVGIYTGNGKFISAESEGITTSSINDPYYWGKYYLGARRIISSETTTVAKPITVAMSDIYKDIPLSHPALQAILALSEDGVINGYKDATFKPENSITRGQTAAMVNRVLNLQAKNPVNFTDVSASNDFAADIAAMNEAGILEGYSNGKFGVYETLTRAQLAVIVDRAFKLQQQADAQVQTASLYKDVPSAHWAADSIQALKVMDQTKVFQTSNFKLGEDASRAEFSAAIFSATASN